MRLAGAAIMTVASLASCASAHIDGAVSRTRAPVATRPTTVLVDVSAPTSTNAAASVSTASELQSELVKDLLKAGLSASIRVAGSSPPDAAILHVSITRSDPGNRTKRLLLGFGSGQAQIRTDVTLELTGEGNGRGSAYDFRTSGNSGYKPGLVLPVGAAAATASIVRLAVGGAVGIATTPKDGLHKPTAETARLIVDQLGTYYRSMGWAWSGR